MPTTCSPSIRYKWHLHTFLPIHVPLLLQECVRPHRPHTTRLMHIDAAVRPRAAPWGGQGRAKVFTEQAMSALTPASTPRGSHARYGDCLGSIQHASLWVSIILYYEVGGGVLKPSPHVNSTLSDFSIFRPFWKV